MKRILLAMMAMLMLAAGNAYAQKMDKFSSSIEKRVGPKKSKYLIQMLCLTMVTLNPILKMPWWTVKSSTISIYGYQQLLLN